ncbi:MAG: hypothetical protein HC828_10070 [Blastochloris sp.]|nr:hypothetical protein [Blastochloris sp.]
MVLAAAPQQAVSELPQHRGYITVAPSKRYFQDEDGRGFVVIGHNDAITWTGLVELLDGSAPHITENYIADLRAHGINTNARDARVRPSTRMGILKQKLVFSRRRLFVFGMNLSRWPSNRDCTYC